MKKITILFGLILMLCAGCTQQMITRQYGGTMTINLPAGQELMEVTWKDDNLFYLTRPMSEDYEPVTKTFKESSSYGIMESTVYFVETR